MLVPWSKGLQSSSDAVDRHDVILTPLCEPVVWALPGLELNYSLLGQRWGHVVDRSGTLAFDPFSPVPAPSLEKSK